MIIAVLRRIISMGLRLLVIGAVAAATLLVVPRAYAALRYQSHVQPVDSLPAAPVGIVFGAGLGADGSPSQILADRVDVAVELYAAGKVQKLLLSGDNRFVDYNEPQSMYEYGLRRNVPAEAMALDFAGRRTYDTCRRARDIFGVTQAVLITQRYHLDRALLTCDALGIQVRGAAADLRPYPTGPYQRWWLRELPATTQALWDVFIVSPRNVILGEPLPLFGAS